MHDQSLVATLFASVTSTGTAGATGVVVVAVLVGGATLGAITFGAVMTIGGGGGVVVVVVGGVIGGGCVVAVMTGTVTGIANPANAELDNLALALCACPLVAP